MIRRLLAEGRSATLYEARHTHPNLRDRRTVLKVLRNRHNTEYFLHQARAHAALRHPRVPAVYEVAEEDGRPYLARAFVEEAAPRLVIGQEPWPVPAVLRVVADVAEVLDFAHRCGFGHGDLHPRHLLFGEDGAMWVIGFGEYPSAGDAAFGNPHLLAPEQLAGAPVTPATDVYALGGVAVWMLCGRAPFAHLSGQELFDAKRTGPTPRSVRAERPDVPAAMAEVLDRALAIDPAARYPGPGTFAAELAAAEHVAPRRRWWLWQ
ncbi:serine/threonine protein kinase [bacterium]|nr:serine/threonine protein kinase [bacterium]